MAGMIRSPRLTAAKVAAAAENNKPLSSVTITFVFTGICAFSPSKPPQPGKKNTQVRFITPKVVKWTKGSGGHPSVPPHKTFLIVKEEDVAIDCDGDWEGRQLDGRVADHVYWIIGRENIRLATDPRNGVTFTQYDIDKVIPLPDIGEDVEIHEDCVKDKDRKYVGARFILQSGALRQRGLTDCDWIMKNCKGTPILCGPLADEIAVVTNDVPLEGGYLRLTSANLKNKAKKERKPITLRPKHRRLEVYAGSAPECDLGAVIGKAPNHDHGPDNLHFALHYLLSRKPPEHAPVPTLVPDSCSGGPPLPGTDTCPPSAG